MSGSERNQHAPEEASPKEDAFLMREKFQKEWDVRARERNKYRDVWQKIFGREKTTGMDIAIEEAIEMDRDIENQLETGRAKTIEEAFNNIEKYEVSEFQIQGKERIKNQEYLRVRALLIAKAIEEDKFHKVKFLHRELKDDIKYKKIEYGMTEIMVVEKIIRNSLKDNIEKSISEGKIYNLVAAIVFCGNYLKKGDVEFTRERLKEPEVMDKVKTHLGYWLSRGYGDSEWIDAAFYNFEKLDILMREEVFRHPAVRKAIEKEVVETFEFYHSSPEGAVKSWANLERLGVISLQRIKALPALHEAAKDRLILQLLAGSEWYYSHLRDDYIRLGILTEEEAANISLLVSQASSANLFKHREN